MQKVNQLTFLLSAVAGYCDTTTFVAGNQTFSAHVTGNFILFAAQVVFGADGSSWLKLTTFPVFIFSVMAGGWLIGKALGRYAALFAESVLLILGGVIAFMAQYHISPDRPWPVYTVVLMVVAALGLQNAFGKVYSQETTGPTTMMTGNVTQAALDLATLIKLKFKGWETDQSLRKLVVNIGGFLSGCLSGAVIAKDVGLAAVGIPGLVLFFWFLKSNSHE